MDVSVVIGRSPFSSGLKLFVGYCVVAVVVVVLVVAVSTTRHVHVRKEGTQMNSPFWDHG